MRIGARKCPDIGAQLERAISGAPLVVGGGGGFGGLRASNLVRQRIVRCLGSCIRIEDTDCLFGMKSEGRVEFGHCRLEGRKLAFDFWLPHYGIAIDYKDRGESEVETKRAWCGSRNVVYIYVSPDEAHLATEPGESVLNFAYFAELEDRIKSEIAGIQDSRQKACP